MDDLLNLLNIDIFQLFGRICLTIIASLILLKIANRSISLSFKKLARRSTLASYKSRLNTLESILNSIISFVVIVVLILLIATDLGFNITPILTGAGILGLAVSFGAQTLVKDLISGFFLILDNQINVGDKVEIDDTEGEVVKILMRNIVIRDGKGNLIYIPNSEVKKIVVFKEGSK